jgi:hypothetical protein
VVAVRLTVDGAFREELETLKCLLSHKVPDGNLAAVLREAVRCAIQKHGKRRGATFHAEETCGREHMARYRRRREPRTGGSALAGERALSVNMAAASASPRSG